MVRPWTAAKWPELVENGTAASGMRVVIADIRHTFDFSRKRRKGISVGSKMPIFGCKFANTVGLNCQGSRNLKEHGVSTTGGKSANTTTVIKATPIQFGNACPSSLRSKTDPRQPHMQQIKFQITMRIKTVSIDPSVIMTKYFRVPHRSEAFAPKIIIVKAIPTVTALKTLANSGGANFIRCHVYKLVVNEKLQSHALVLISVQMGAFWDPAINAGRTSGPARWHGQPSGLFAFLKSVSDCSFPRLPLGYGKSGSLC